MSKPKPESPFKANILKGQVALITGGGSGINLGIATQLAAHGCNLVLVGRRLNVVEEAASKIASQHKVKAIGLSCDVRKFEICEEVVKKTQETFGRLDILINGAAGNFLAPAEKLSSNGFKTVFEIDVFGTFNMSRAAFELLKANPNKSTLIVNVTANLSRIHAPYQIHAAAAKDAIEGMTLSWANEWGPYGVRAVSVAPGFVEDTEGFDRLGGFAMQDKVQYAKDTVPLGYFASTLDIAFAVLYLASAAGRYISGTTLIIDGGNWVNRKADISPKQLEEITSKLRGKPPAAKL